MKWNNRFEPDDSLDYTPKTNCAEWHVTYKCDLTCNNCNRFCFLPPTTKDMTLDDAKDFVRQCKEINWYPEIILMGGEPTLHKDFFEFIKVAQEITDDITIYSNAYSDMAKEKLKRAEEEGVSFVFEPTWKLEGTVEDLPNQNVFLAPIDYGVFNHGPCDWHSAKLDVQEYGQNKYGGGHHGGISVDSDGYSLCPIGGAIDGLLKLGLRTKNLKQLFEKEFSTWQTRNLCDHCGGCFDKTNPDENHPIPKEVEKLFHTVAYIHGSPMSPTYQNAIKKNIGEKVYKRLNK